MKILLFLCLQISQAAIEKTSMKKSCWQNLFAFLMVPKKYRSWSQCMSRKFQHYTLKGHWKRRYMYTPLCSDCIGHNCSHPLLSCNSSFKEVPRIDLISENQSDKYFQLLCDICPPNPIEGCVGASIDLKLRE
jgi:hypothetical protein